MGFGIASSRLTQSQKHTEIVTIVRTSSDKMLNIKPWKKLPNYCSAFGFFKGISLLSKIERSLPPKSSHVRAYRVPGYESPIYLRDSLSDHSIFWQCIVDTQYDFRRFPHAARLLDAYKDLVAKGKQPLILDCGGNIGLSSLWLARMFPDARIVIVEPDADNVRMISMNTSQLGDRVKVLTGGVWHESGFLGIVNPDSGSAAFRVARVSEDDPNAIRAYSLPEILAMENAEAFFVVKIDIEGSQRALFSESTDWVGNVPLIMLELDDWQFPWQGSSRPFFSTVSKYPMDYLIRGETIFCFQDLYGDTPVQTHSAQD